MNVVVKIGTSSITDDDGRVERGAVAKIAADIVDARAAGHEIVVVSSGAIAAGLPAMGLTARERPKDPRTLQAVSAVGQAHLMGTWNECFAAHDMVAGQVLLVPDDLNRRSTYLQARATLARLTELGVVPIINENDAIADDEIRIGDNDRIAALVAHLIRADLLVLLTDAPGLLTADPRVDDSASLIEDVIEVDHELEALAGGSGSNRGSGGMATKLAAARIATWSGVRTVIARAGRPNVLADAIGGVQGVGTIFRPAGRRLSARKVWIAFAVGATGSVHVDAGARSAVLADKSLLAPGIRKVEGEFRRGDAVEIVGPDGDVFGKGTVRFDAAQLSPGVDRGVAVHKDDLVLLS